MSLRSTTALILLFEGSLAPGPAAAEMLIMPYYLEATTLQYSCNVGVKDDAGSDATFCELYIRGVIEGNDRVHACMRRRGWTTAELSGGVIRQITRDERYDYGQRASDVVTSLARKMCRTNTLP
jgi:hypothetical protein